MPRKNKVTILSDTTPPVLSSAITDSTGLKIIITFTDNISTNLVLSSPLSNIDGFSIILQSGVFTPDTAVLGTTPMTVVLTFNEKRRILYNQVITVNYTPGSNTIADTSSNTVVAFSTIVTNIVNSPLFDPILYSNNRCSVTGGDLYRYKNNATSSANILLDTTPPYGDIVINENVLSGGIKVHHFCSYVTIPTVPPDTTTIPIASLLGVHGVSVNHYYAIQLISPNETTINGIQVYLKAIKYLTGSDNSAADADSLVFKLYSDVDGFPGVILANLGSLSYNTLTTTLSPYNITSTNLNYDLSYNTTYWIVISKTIEPTNSIVYIDSTNSTGTTLIANSPDGSLWNLDSLHSIPVLFLSNFVVPSGNTSSTITLQPLSGTMVIVDPTNVPVSTPFALGGTAFPNKFEILGLTNKRSIVQYFGVLGKNVTAIEFGVTSDIPKAYDIECQVVRNGSWHRIMSMISDPLLTDNYFRYQFSQDINLFGVRLRYRGDYYATVNNASISVTGVDTYTSTNAIQVSHFADFRDATDFPNTDTNGWLNFNDGTSYYNWDLVNLKREWTELNGFSVERFSQILPITNYLLVGGNGYYIYKISQNVPMTVVYDATLTHISWTASGTLNNKIYLGMSDGSILDALTFVKVAQLPNNATNITCMQEYGGVLYIGVSVNPGGILYLYAWDGTAASPVAFKQFQQLSINDIAVANNILYIGLGGASGGLNGIIYQYDGKTWKIFYNTGFDSVNSILYSSADQRLWICVNNGVLFAYTFGNSPTWQNVYNGQSSKYLLIDDVNKQYVWMVGDKDIVAYSVAKNRFISVVQPMTATLSAPGLTGSWYTNIIQDTTIAPKSGTFIVQQNWNNSFSYVNLDTLPVPNGVGGRTSGPPQIEYFNVVFEGFITAPTSELYTLSTVSDDGVRIYIDGIKVLDGYTYATVHNVSGTFNFVKNIYYPCRIEYYNADRHRTLGIRWTSATTALQFIPASAFITEPLFPVVTNMAYLGTQPYACCSDGRVFKLADNDISNFNRTVYLKLKDNAGNITQAPVYTDSILQDTPQNTSGQRLPNGYIYQLNPITNKLTTYFKPSNTAQVFGGTRTVLQDGSYISEPFYAVTMSQWNLISFLVSIPATTPTSDLSLEAGVEIDLYVRTGDTEELCLAADWGSPFVVTSLPNGGGTQTVDTAGVGNFSISSYSGKWLQYKLVLLTGSLNATPLIHSVTLSYTSALSSYFFTKVFDTSMYPYSTANPPTIRRGMIATNDIPGNGQIIYGYSLNSNSVLDFSQYNIIKPGEIFELSAPVSTIQFGIQLVSDNTPAVVDGFGVLLDTGTDRIKFMKN